MKNKTTIELLRQNWPLILATVAFIATFVTLQTKVAANELRVKAVEEQVAEYPSADFFILKFEQIDKKLDSIDDKLVNLDN